MTLCLAISLAEKRSFDLKDQIQRYINWCHHGYMSSSKGYAFDVGLSTRVALDLWAKEFERPGDGLTSGQERINGSLNKDARCGNGSLMRTAPIALIYWQDSNEKIDDLTAKAGSVTHPHQQCVEACQVYVRMICSILRSEDQLPSKEDLFGDLKDFTFETPKLKETFSAYRTLDDIKQAPDSTISSSGFVVHTLEAALWAFFSTESFRDGAIKAVNLGDDADTVGAVYGGLAGAYYGLEEVPEDWIHELQARSTIDNVVTKVVELVSSQPAS